MNPSPPIAHCSAPVHLLNRKSRLVFEACEGGLKYFLPSNLVWFGLVWFVYVELGLVCLLDFGLFWLRLVWTSLSLASAQHS